MDVLIVGASVSGVRAAQALRRQAFEGRITVLGDEPHLPYDKPQLSKSLLFGAWEPDAIRLAKPQDLAASDIEVRTGCQAVGLDPEKRTVQLADDSEVAYDVLVIATGAAARPAPWTVPAGVHELRSLDDCQALRSSLNGGGPLVIVGGGFIGAEVAGGARKKGIDVTIVDPYEHPAAVAVGADLAPSFAALHERNGVRTRFGVSVDGIHGRAGDLDVHLSDGEVLSAASVLVCIGAVPNDQWLRASGLPLDNGVLCTNTGLVLGHPDVYAVGDVASWPAPTAGHRRFEHWTNAVEQANVVAHNITHPGQTKTYSCDGYVWSDQHDWKIQIVGRPTEGTLAATFGDLKGTRVRAVALFSNPEDALTGSVTVNWSKASILVRRALSTSANFAEVRDKIAGLPDASGAVAAAAAPA